MNHRNEVEPNDTDYFMLILSPKLNQIVNHMIYLFIIEIEFQKLKNIITINTQLNQINIHSTIIQLQLIIVHKISIRDDD